MTLPGVFRDHISLMHGWLPITVQIVAGLLLIAAIGWRNRRWRLVWLPSAAAIGIALAVGTYWYIASEGLSDDSNPAPYSLWVWVGLSGTAAVVLIAGWRGARWWRRGLSALALPVCVLCSALALNVWVGYLPTVQNAWSQATAGPLPDQTDAAAVTAMRIQHAIPAKGSVVPVDIPGAASGFKHRTELIYLPPAWYATEPPPRLPAVMMIGAEFNSPTDWLRAGDAIKTIDDFAAAHGGNAPILVFADAGGSFRNDTECVNGSRGNAADHLTKDVIPFVISRYGASPTRTGWGVVGFSMGGTCAVDLTVMHPDKFSAFEDIEGDLTPNAGNRTQTIARLFGGNAAAFAAFDPMTVMALHGTYTGVAGWFAINGQAPSSPHPVVLPAAASPDDQGAAANTLCATAAAHGINCAVVSQPGKHDWPFAARAFGAALPWLAGQLGTPTVPLLPLPGPPTAPPGPPPAGPHPGQKLQAAGK